MKDEEKNVHDKIISKITIEEETLKDDYDKNEDINKTEVNFIEVNPKTVYKNNKQSTNFFTKEMLIICLISVLGGVSLGVGIGVGTTFSRTYITNRGNYILFTNSIEESSRHTFNIENSQSMYEEEMFRQRNALTNIVSSVKPSVVKISASTYTTNTVLYREINTPRRSGSGTGIIFYKDLQNIYIATNYHVISEANSVSVSIDGSGPIDATLVGHERDSDIAVISVSMEDARKAGVQIVNVATFGNSDNIQVGEVVLAIGNALGEGNTVTLGIVSARDKEISIEGRELQVIQTDAAINQGNSGGPLVNMDGEVIGINTAKISQSVGVGMGYSISSNIAVPIIQDIMNQEPRPFLGILGTDITRDIANTYSLPAIGVFVLEVLDDTGAYKAGIRNYDIITSFNGQTVNSMGQLVQLIQQSYVGEVVEIRGIREGTQHMVFNVTMYPYTHNQF
jgi:serine protease Do